MSQNGNYKGQLFKAKGDYNLSMANLLTVRSLQEMAYDGSQRWLLSKTKFNKKQ